MDCRKIALSVVAIGVALVGCNSTPTYEFPARNRTCAAGAAQPCATSEGESEVREVPETTPDTTYMYVVELIDLPIEMGGRVAGFNLDGLDSGAGSTAADANCEEYNPDYVNSVEASHVGVDNALQSLVPTIEGLLDAADCPGGTTEGCLGATLQGQILDGSLILLVQVSGVNDFAFDSDVTLQMYLGEVPGGGAPNEGGGGGLAPGQEFNALMPVGSSVPGDIFQGRLRAQTPLLTIAIMTTDFTIPLMISNAEVRFDIGEGTLTNGQIGGYLTTASIIEAASMIMPGIEETVRSVVESIADVSPSAADPAICESVSVGLTFGATSAVCTTGCS